MIICILLLTKLLLQFEVKPFFKCYCGSDNFPQLKSGENWQWKTVVPYWPPYILSAFLRATDFNTWRVNFFLIFISIFLFYVLVLSFLDLSVLNISYCSMIDVVLRYPFLEHLRFSIILGGMESFKWIFSVYIIVIYCL